MVNGKRAGWMPREQLSAMHNGAGMATPRFHLQVSISLLLFPVLFNWDLIIDDGLPCYLIPSYAMVISNPLRDQMLRVVDCSVNLHLKFMVVRHFLAHIPTSSLRLTRGVLYTYIFHTYYSEKFNFTRGNHLHYFLNLKPAIFSKYR